MEFINVTKSLLSGFSLTCLIFIFTLIFAIPLGLLISFLSMSKVRWIKKATQTLVWIVRGIPLMLQLFMVYYLPGLLLGPSHNPFGKLDNTLYFSLGIDMGGALLATLIAFIINYACYFSEIFRGGIESITSGQREAGEVLGMTKSQIFSKVILLQVVKRIVPPMSNEIITLVKDTALARVIGILEIIRCAELFSAKALIWPLFYAGVFYLAFVGILTILFNLLEKKLSYFEA